MNHRVVAATVLAAALAVLGITMPWTPSLSAATAGDEALAARVRAAAGSGTGFRSLAVAEVTRDGATYAAVGDAGPGRGPISPTDPVELGSITKTFDGLLLADAIARGEVAATDTLGDHLPELAGSEVGTVTLEGAVSHRGAIPPLPPSLMPRALLSLLRNDNPYAGITREAVLAEAARLSLTGERGQSVVYSNLGATLAGYALGKAAGYDAWEPYATDRLLTPLGMAATTFAATDAEVPRGAVPGWTDNGRPAPAWPSPAFRPAGASTYATMDDLVRYAQAVLAGTAPGLDAMDPRWEAFPATRIGYAWFTTTQPSGRQVAWHNGGTGGFRTLLAIDRDAGKAVIVVGNTTQSVDEVGFALLGEEPSSRPVPVVGLALLGMLAVAVVAWLLRARRETPRVKLVGSLADAVALLAVTRVLGPWSFVPGWTWALLGSLVAVGVALVVPRWSTLPTHPPRWRRTSLVMSTVSVLLATAAVMLLR